MFGIVWNKPDALLLALLGDLENSLFFQIDLYVSRIDPIVPFPTGATSEDYDYFFPDVYFDPTLVYFYKTSTLVATIFLGGNSISTGSSSLSLTLRSLSFFLHSWWKTV